MKILFPLSFGLLLLANCAPPAPKPEIISTLTSEGRVLPFGKSDSGDFLTFLKPTLSPTYGYSQEDPVKVDNGDNRGTGYSIAYLNSLRGPKGEVISYQRRGSCCRFKLPSSDAHGLLDIYDLTYQGCQKPIVIYLNIYEKGEMFIPLGLTAKK